MANHEGLRQDEKRAFVAFDCIWSAGATAWDGHEAYFMDSTWSFWSSEPRRYRRSSTKITLEKYKSHEPHPSLLYDPAPAAGKTRGCTVAISGSKSCYLMNPTVATNHFISPSAHTRYRVVQEAPSPSIRDITCWWLGKS